MAKYVLEATETFETIIPASTLEFHNLVTGQKSGNSLSVPESKHTTLKGTRYTARRKADAEKMISSGKWKLVG